MGYVRTVDVFLRAVVECVGRTLSNIAKIACTTRRNRMGSGVTDERMEDAMRKSAQDGRLIRAAGDRPATRPADRTPPGAGLRVGKAINHRVSDCAVINRRRRGGARPVIG